MPLNCDCYGGCWGDHSKDWPRIEGDAARIEKLYRLCHTPKNIVPYGSFVLADGALRLETEAYLQAVLDAEQDIGGRLGFAALRVANLSRCARWHPGGLSEWSLSDWGVAAAGEMGEALNVIKKLNRERDGAPGNVQSEPELRAMLADEIADVVIYLDIMAASENIDLASAIISKFNRTSERVGFPERLTEVR